jgi:hypothetical protein
MYNPLIKRQKKPNYYAPYQGAKPGIGPDRNHKHPKHPKPGPRLQKGK